MPELTLQGILAITLVTTMLFDQFICYFCCAVQLNTSTVVDSAVLSGHIVFQPFVGRETAVLIYSANGISFCLKSSLN